MKLTLIPEELDNDLKGKIYKIKMHILANSLQDTLSKLLQKSHLVRVCLVHSLFSLRSNTSI